MHYSTKFYVRVVQGSTVYPQRPYFQIRSHSGVLGRHKFGVYSINLLQTFWTVVFFGV